MSLVPMGGHKIAPNPALVEQLPRRLPRAPGSWPRTTRAKRGSRAKSRTPSRCAATSARSPRSTPAGSTDEIVPLPSTLGATDGAGAATQRDVRVDEGPRRDTSLEALAKLRPAFHVAAAR